MKSLLTRLAATLIFLLLGLSSALAQDDEQAWKSFLQKNSDELVQKANDFSAREKQLQDEVRDLRQNTKLLEKKLSQMSVVTSLSGHNPFELKAALAAVGKLGGEAEKLLKPHMLTQDEVKKLDVSMAAFEQEIAKLSSDINDPQITPILDYYRKYVAGARARMDKSLKSLDHELTPASQMLGDIKEVSGNLSGKITRAWQEYYFTALPSPLSVAAWRDLAKQWLTWLKNLEAYKNFTQGDDSAQLVDIVSKVGQMCLAFGLVWLLGRKKLGKRLTPQSRGLARKLYFQFALALTFAYASSGAPLLLYELISAISEIFFALAFANLCWALRPLGDPEEAASPNPLLALTFVFAASLLVCQVLPAGSLQAVLFLLLLIPAIRALGKIAPAVSGRYKFIAPLSRAYCIVLALLTLAGWLNLAMLIFAGYYLFLLSGLGGLALYRFLRLKELELAAANGRILPLWLMRGLGYPSVYLGAFLWALYWFCARLGGHDVFFDLLFRQAGTAQVSFSLWRLFLILSGFYLAKASLAASLTLCDRLAARRQSADRGSADILRAASTYGIWVLYGLVSLSLLGIDMSSIAVIAGGLSVGIGFGLQNVVNNFVAGLILLFGRAIQTGDTIQIGETMGSVSKVNIRNTIVQTGDNATLFVPNSELIGQKLINWTHKDPRVKREVSVRAAYGSDIDQVVRILLEAAQNNPLVLKDPAPAVFFQNFGETALEFSLSVWFGSLSGARAASSNLRSEIYRQGKEKGVAWTPAGNPA